MKAEDLPELEVYKALGFSITDVVPERESAEYCAFRFMANNRKMLFRKSKITPTKNGQFVTIWKREGNNPIEPFSEDDDITTVIICTEKDNCSGQFIFPVSVLYSQKIFTANGKEGKRAFRVYPPWDVPQSKQAATTQKWQLQYFMPTKNNTFSNLDKVFELFSRH